MLNYQYILTKKNLFQVTTGFSYFQFEKLLPKFSSALRKAEYQRIPEEKRIRQVGGGRKSKLVTDKQKLFFILFYYRHYPTMRLAQVLFEIEISNLCHWAHFLSGILFEALGYQLELPEVRVNSLHGLFTVCPALKEFIVDGTERPIRRPKDSQKQKQYYSGRKRDYTIKNQVVIHPKSKRILSVSKTVEGKMHDKTLLEETGLLTKAPPGSCGLGDSGYEGVRKTSRWLKFVTPLKRKSGRERTEAEKQTNKSLSSLRVRAEHVIGRLKVNRILTHDFRSNLGFADLVFRNCACLYNFRLNYS
ncbi:transposase [Candidatus Gottesmanbacteria bacterium]|nr:transposase [Candidatus Gottesmanbacteria bacterium]